MASFFEFGGGGILLTSASIGGGGEPTGSLQRMFFETPTSTGVDFQIRIPSQSTGASDEDTIALYLTASGISPFVGIGTNDPKTALDVKDFNDNGEGTIQVFESSRSGRGGDVGDKAGTLLFTVPSSSFGDYKTSGSIASIESEITSISELGVTGDLIFKSAASVKTAPTEVFRVNQTTSYFSSSLRTRQALLIGTSTVQITNEEDTPSGDSIETIDSFSDSSFKGAVYDYTLIDSSNGYARIGNFMVISDGSSVSFTDTSAKALGGDSTEPTLTADRSSGLVRLRITNGNGYVFKSLRKLI